MVKARRARIQLKGVMVWNVIGDRCAADILVARGADRGATRVHGTWLEASLKPAPGDALGVHQITDVLARHGDLGAGLGGAIVQRSGRPGVPDQRTARTDDAGG